MNPEYQVASYPDINLVDESPFTFAFRSYRLDRGLYSE